MLIKTSEAKDLALDWAVAKLVWSDREVFVDVWPSARVVEVPVNPHSEQKFRYEPSTNWAQGGPIIEREQIDIMSRNKATRNDWIASRWAAPWYNGPTPLIAAMRCYVAAKLGDEVEVPDELVKE